MRSGKRLLIMSCSRKKNKQRGQLPAIERYDGPSFKVLRKFFRMNETNLEVYILSAKYGLIPANKKITMYDMILNPEKAEKVKPEIASELEKLELKRYESICLFLSKIYLLALPEIDENIEKSIFKIQAPQGKRLTLLKQWLWHDNIEHSPECKPVKRDKPKGSAILRGIKINADYEEAERIVKAELDSNPSGAFNYRKWYVEIADKNISPKWIVSKLTKLPVSEFTSGEARRVLHHLEIECKQVQ